MKLFEKNLAGHGIIGILVQFVVIILVNPCLSEVTSQTSPMLWSPAFTMASFMELNAIGKTALMRCFGRRLARTGHAI